MTNVQALVGQAIGGASTLDGLLEIYNGYAARSKVERMRMRRELAYIKDVTLFDSRALFSLADVFRLDLTPVVAMAPIAATKVGFGMRDSSRAFFEINRERYMSFAIPDEAIARRKEARIAELAKMSDWQRQWEMMRSDFFWSSFDRVSHEAHVPPTPKSVLPWNPITRRKLHVLFDADWKALPVDPYLLERKNEHQFKVVGHWDLTPQERKIMELIAR